MSCLRLLSLMLALLLVGCGGGSSRSFSITANPTALTFTASQSESSTPPQTVTVTFEGDGVLVGYPPGQAEPAWLSIQLVSGNTSPLRFELRANPQAASVGTQQATVRFVTGSADGENVRVADVQISLTVRGAAQVIPREFQQAALEGVSPTAVEEATVFHNGTPQQVTAQPSWVTASLTRLDAASQRLRLSYNTASLAAGSYSGAVTMAAADGSSNPISVTVDLTVRKAELRVDKTSLGFSAVCGVGTLPAAQTLRVASESSKSVAFGSRVEYLSGSSGWLPKPADGTTPANAGVQPGTTNLAVGSHTAQLLLRRSDETNPQAGQTVSVGYSITANTPLAAPTTASFTINAATTLQQLSQSLTLGDDGAPLSWQLVATGANWLTASPARGDTRNAKTLTLQIDSTKLAALENGSFTAILSLRFDSASSNCPSGVILNVPVTLNLALPTIEGVMPFTAVVGAGLAHAVGGTGFDGGTSLQLKVGDQPVAVRDAVSNQVLRFVAPALQAGSYAVTIDNALGITRRAGTLRYVAAPTFATQKQTVARANMRTLRMLHDPQRNRLYALEAAPGTLTSTIYSYSANALGMWSRTTLVTLAGLSDFDLAADGSKLWLAADKLFSLDLDTAGANPVEVYQHRTASGTASSLTFVRALVNGELLASNPNSQQVVTYQPRTNLSTMLQVGGSYCPGVSAAPDGSVGFVLNVGCSTPQNSFYVYRLGVSPLEGDGNGRNPSSLMSPDRHGARGFYYDRLVNTVSHQLLASLEFGEDAVFSPDGSTLITTPQPSGSNPPTTINVYNVSVAPANGTYTKTPETFPNDNAGTATRLALSANGRTLFVAASNGLLILPRN